MYTNNKLTFKEQLTASAEAQLKKSLSIEDHLKFIKAALQQYVTLREYSIYLFKSQDKSLALGGNCNNCFQTFIPKNIDPIEYCQLFINAFIELGFTWENMSYETKHEELWDLYVIKLKW